MIKRDKEMVNQGHQMLCFWNGDDKGGTAATVQMGIKKSHTVDFPIRNAWQPWASFMYKVDESPPFSFPLDCLQSRVLSTGK